MNSLENGSLANYYRNYDRMKQLIALLLVLLLIPLLWRGCRNGGNALTVTSDTTQLIVGQQTTLRGTSGVNGAATVELFNNGTFLGRANVGTGGVWEVQTAFAEAGEQTLEIKALSATGEVLGQSSPIPLTINLPDLAVNALLFDTPRIVAGMPPQVTLSGSGLPNSQIILTSADGLFNEEIAINGEGRWEVTTTAFERAGNVTLYAEGVNNKMRASTTVVILPEDLFSSGDEDGGTATAVAQMSTPTPLITLTETPSAEATNDLSSQPTFQLGGISADNRIDPKDPLRIFGQANAGERVQIMANNIVLDTITAAEDGSWSWERPLADYGLTPGHYQIKTVTYDTTGTRREVSAPIEINAESASLASFDFSSLRDGVPDDGSLSISGHAPVGTTVEIVLDKQIVGSVPVSSPDGTWRWNGTIPTTTVKVHELVVQIINPDSSVLLTSTPQLLVKAVNLGPIPTMVEGVGIFNTLLAAISKVELRETLASGGPFTLLAPTDEAFARLPDGVLNQWLENPTQLRTLLLYHLLPGRISSAEFIHDTTVETLSEKMILVQRNDKTVMINRQASFIAADIAAQNGMIQAIDTVLIPPSDMAPPIIDRSGVPTFVGPNLTIVGMGEPNTRLLVELNGSYYGESVVSADGSWLVAGTVLPGYYEIIAYSFVESELKAISDSVFLTALEP